MTTVPIPTMPMAKRLGAVLATLVAALLLFFAGMAHAAEPVKISRDDTALDLTATTEIYTN
ncbi:hypothetical protein, partial [Rhizobium sp. A41-96]